MPKTQQHDGGERSMNSTTRNLIVKTGPLARRGCANHVSVAIWAPPRWGASSESMTTHSSNEADSKIATQGWKKLKEWMHMSSLTTPQFVTSSRRLSGWSFLTAPVVFIFCCSMFGDGARKHKSL
eukprot:GEMP01089876.1.p1 GENE.GEMP01089876.1~~GEMP01089876.1.p1  ORF type:complete len:125 (+),score=7.25 GEMP01089876.1:245-619(+)